MQDNFNIPQKVQVDDEKYLAEDEEAVSDEYLLIDH